MIMDGARIKYRIAAARRDLNTTTANIAVGKKREPEAGGVEAHGVPSPAWNLKHPPTHLNYKACNLTKENK